MSTLPNASTAAFTMAWMSSSLAGVRRHGEHLAAGLADLRRHLVQARLLAGGDDHPGPGRGEFPGDALPDATACAGDDGHLVLQREEIAHGPGFLAPIVRPVKRAQLGIRKSFTTAMCCMFAAALSEARTGATSEIGVYTRLSKTSPVG